MTRIQAAYPQLIESLGGTQEEVAKAGRAASVRRMWAQIMRRGGDEYILQHTNNVFILNAGDAHRLRSDHDDRKDAGRTGRGKQLIAYVDESIVAAELNARRELVKLQFFQEFGEEIDEFKIIISRGQYKRHHPFALQVPADQDEAPSVPLDDGERLQVAQRLAAIDDARLRRKVERAMVTDLEWKKGLAE